MNFFLASLASMYLVGRMECMQFGFSPELKALDIEAIQRQLETQYVWALVKGYLSTSC